eukprot:scaffold159389_cov15-Tisochrysis_lutea.AAC.1
MARENAGLPKDSWVKHICLCPLLHVPFFLPACVFCSGPWTTSNILTAPRVAPPRSSHTHAQESQAAASRGVSL